jgi:hypothetical protein
VFWGQYLPLSLSKRGVPYIKKKERKRQVQKKSRSKKIRSAVVQFYQGWELIHFLPGLKTGLILLVRLCRSDLSDFTKAKNLSVFTRAENWSDLACPFVPLGLVRFYQGWELGPFLPGLKIGPILLVRFARFYQGWELVSFYQGWELVRFFQGVRTCPVFPRAENLSDYSSWLSS